MDERRSPAARTASLSLTRIGVLAAVALGASYGGAFLTSEWLARLAFDPGVPDWLAPRGVGAPRPAGLLLIAAGGIVIGLAAVALAARLGWRRPRAAAESHLAPIPLEQPIVPAASLAWLHLVGGPSSRRVAHAAAELVAPWVSHGERVLLIDGGPRLRLHVPLLAEPALGLAECMRRDVPLLGVVQCVGVPGLYLLVHGGPVAPRDWAGLGRLADAARQHFDRVVVALDLGAPHDVGRALAGRYVEAWWPDPDPERRAGAQSLSDRIGIRMRGMQLGQDTKPMLELLRERVSELRPTGAPRPEALAVGEARPRPAPPAAPRLDPLVLDCDLQVRERLRFLIWMRTLQTGNRGRAAAARACAPAVAQTVNGG